jgi:hypothetical protein
MRKSRDFDHYIMMRYVNENGNDDILRDDLSSVVEVVEAVMMMMMTLCSIM